jgi:hypothetical protein
MGVKGVFLKFKEENTKGSMAGPRCNLLTEKRVSALQVIT